MAAAGFERWSVRVVVAAAFVAALAGGVLLPHTGAFPSVALGTTWIFYGLRALAIFYGTLLLVVPLLRALRGDLPIELTWRGARYAEVHTASSTTEELHDRVVHLEERSEELALLVGAGFERIRLLESRPRRTSQEHE